MFRTNVLKAPSEAVAECPTHSRNSLSFLRRLIEHIEHKKKEEQSRGT